MAVLEIRSINQNKAYILKPNCSLSGRQVCLAFALIAAALLAVTLYFLFLGAWLVLPFAGLELLVLGIAVYCQYQWSKKQQLIEIDSENITASSDAKGTNRITIPKAWLRIKLVNGQSRWHPKRLILGSHGRFIEVGEFLVESEREELALKLKASL